MKKVFIVFAMSAALTTIASMKAEGANNGNDAATIVEVAQRNDTVIYEFGLRLRDMNRAMKLDIDQIEALQLVNREMRRSIANIGNLPVEKRQERLTNVLTNNLMEVRGRVDDEQYRAYLQLINNEFNRSGLSNVLLGIEVAEK